MERGRVVTHGLLVGLLVLLIPGATAFADVLKLQNGVTVYGTITQETQSTVTIDVAGQQRLYSKSEISDYWRETPSQLSSPVDSAAGPQTAQLPIVVMQQQQQQQESGAASALTLEQEWNNAFYYAQQAEAKACRFRATGTWELLFAGVSVVGGSVWLSNAYYQEEEIGAAVVIGLGLALAVDGVLEFVLGPRRCATARSESNRLAAIGSQKGWAYLGVPIAPPSYNANVVVRKEDSVLDWLMFFNSLAD